MLRLLAAAFALTAPAIVCAQAPTLQTVDIETINRVTFDAMVSCTRHYGTYVSGSFEGCPTGRAPATGECGLGFACPDPISVPDAVADADHYWTHLYLEPVVLDLDAPSDSVFVFNAADHAPFPEESIEWTVWGSDSPDVSRFPGGWELASLCAVFARGWVESGA